MVKVTPDDILKMIELYQSLGSYAAVAREMNISSSTASKYIKQYQAAQTAKDNQILFKDDVPLPHRVNLEKNWADSCKLTDVEIKEVQELWKELSI